MNIDRSLPCINLEIEMGIKGIREALTKKQAPQHPEFRVADAAVQSDVSPVRSVPKKPLKKVTGRGR